MLEVRQEALKQLLDDLTSAVMNCPENAIARDEHLALESRFCKLMETIREKLEMMTGSVLRNRCEEKHGHRDEVDELKISRMEIFEAVGSIEKRPRCQIVDSKKKMRDLPMTFGSKTKASKKFGLCNRDVAKTSWRCQLCDESHRLWMCKKFEALALADRWSFVVKQHLCFLCLRKGHRTPDCSRKNLMCQSCDGSHGRLLHDERPADDVPRMRDDLSRSETGHFDWKVNSRTFVPSQTKKKIVERSQKSSRSFVTMRRKTMLSTVVVLVADADGKMQSCRALLDSGSEPNFITPACVRRLKLKTEKAHLPVVGINGRTTVSKKSVRANVVSRYGPFEKRLELFVLPNITGKLPSENVDIKKLGVPDNLFLADPKFNESADCDMLLNNVVFMKALLNGNLELPTGPSMVETKFGWIVGGEMNEMSPSSTSLLCSSGRVANPKAEEIDVIEDVDVELSLVVDDARLATAMITTAEKLADDSIMEEMNFGLDGQLIVEMPMKESSHQSETKLVKAKRDLAWLEIESGSDTGDDDALFGVEKTEMLIDDVVLSTEAGINCFAADGLEQSGCSLSDDRERTETDEMNFGLDGKLIVERPMKKGSHQSEKNDLEAKRALTWHGMEIESKADDDELSGAEKTEKWLDNVVPSTQAGINWFAADGLEQSECSLSDFEEQIEEDENLIKETLGIIDLMNCDRFSDGLELTDENLNVELLKKNYQLLDWFKEIWKNGCGTLKATLLFCLLMFSLTMLNLVMSVGNSHVSRTAKSLKMLPRHELNELTETNDCFDRGKDRLKEIELRNLETTECDCCDIWEKQLRLKRRECVSVVFANILSNQRLL